MSKEPVKAYSTATKVTYNSWDDLVAMEADGYLLIIVAIDKQTGAVKFANATGGGMTQQQARNKAARMRRQLKKQWWRKNNYRFFVRPAWIYDFPIDGEED